MHPLLSFFFPLSLYFGGLGALALGAAGPFAFDTQTFAVTATNALSGASAARLHKLGAGTLTLSGNSLSTFAGVTQVYSGTLNLTGA
ncbi:MAG: autotransporter-associated beta strand repeat-containing protein, partial [Opitutaceae bacterium]|nr:autotransporter-associated beta strand repeat-containing protein [Opitutaceae bacterium]